MSALTFLGAARTVTGSKYLLEHGKSRILVDCGIFQGLKASIEEHMGWIAHTPGQGERIEL